MTRNIYLTSRIEAPVSILSICYLQHHRLKPLPNLQDSLTYKFLSNIHCIYIGRNLHNPVWYQYHLLNASKILSYTIFCRTNKLLSNIHCKWTRVRSTHIQIFCRTYKLLLNIHSIYTERNLHNPVSYRFQLLDARAHIDSFLNKFPKDHILIFIWILYKQENCLLFSRCGTWVDVTKKNVYHHHSIHKYGHHHSYNYSSIQQLQFCIDARGINLMWYLGFSLGPLTSDKEELPRFLFLKTGDSTSEKVMWAKTLTFCFHSDVVFSVENLNDTFFRDWEWFSL